MWRHIALLAFVSEVVAAVMLEAAAVVTVGEVVVAALERKNNGAAVRLCQFTAPLWSSPTLARAEVALEGRMGMNWAFCLS